MTALARASRSTELSLVGMAVIWGVNFSVMKYGTQAMVPNVYNALRMGIACVILLVLAYAQRGLRPSAPSLTPATPALPRRSRGARRARPSGSPAAPAGVHVSVRRRRAR